MDMLSTHFKDGETVNPANLVKNGIIRTVKGKTPEVKILAKGTLTKKVVVENCKVSKTAKMAIEKTGGSVR